MSVPLLLRYTDFLLNASRLLRLDSARGFVCWLLIAPWYSGPCASVSHCCSTGTSVFDRACIRRQLLEHLHPLLFSQICVSCSVTLGCFVNSCLLLAMLLFHGFLGPNSWLFVNGFSGPNPWLFYFLHNPWLRVFHSTKPNDFNANFSFESLLLFTPWNQLNFYVTGFKNTQAFRDNRSCHFHAQLC